MPYIRIRVFPVRLTVSFTNFFKENQDAKTKLNVLYTVPLMNHHTIPKLGFGPLKTTAGRFFLPKILTGTANDPADQMDSKKR